jgi:hypothetical protein
MRTLEVEAKLKNCPDLPDANVQSTIIKLLQEFSTDARRIMDGESIDNTTEFQSECSGLMDIFRDIILHMKPTVEVGHDSDRLIPDVIDLLSEDEDEETQGSIPQNRKRPAQGDLEPSRRHKVKRDSDTPAPQTPVGQSRFVSTPGTRNSVYAEGSFMSAPPIPAPNFRKVAEDRFAKTPFAKFSGFGRKFINLEGIRKLITNHVRPGNPYNANPKTHDELAMLAVDMWDGPLQVFMTETFEKLKDQLQAILKKHLGKYEQTQLYRTAATYLDEFIEGHISEQRQALEDLYGMEKLKLFTVNKSAMRENEAKEYAALKAGRRRARAKAWSQRQMRMDPRKYPHDMVHEDYNRALKKKSDEVKDEQLGADPFDLELRVAAYVRAYYVTAGIRFVDSVCLSVHSKMFRNIKDTILYHLESKLDIAGRDGKSPSMCLPCVNY